MRFLKRLENIFQLGTETETQVYFSSSNSKEKERNTHTDDSKHKINIFIRLFILNRYEYIFQNSDKNMKYVALG